MSFETKPARAGQTEKISVSVDRAELVALRRRARRLYAGNVSAAVVEGIRRIREEEGREGLVAWLGSAGDASPGQRDTIRAEWKSVRRRTRSRRLRKTR